MSDGLFTFEVFAGACDAARRLNRYVPPERTRAAAPAPSHAKGDRPGDDYNRRASWADILAPHGWRVERSSGPVTYWTRPGKDGGVSATTGFCKGETTGDLLYVFSSNAHPFEPDTGYDKFGALAALEHAGNLSAAAERLKSEGYGKPDPVAILGAPRAAGAERGFRWASELSAPDKAEEWLWEGYLAKGGITLLSALWKAGKTTLLSHLLRAFGVGGDFAGKPVRACKVLYVSEEGARHWVRRRDALGIGDYAGFYLQPFAVRPRAADWLAFVAQLREDVKAHGFDLVVFDTLAKLWPVTEENNASDVDAALMPLWEITKAGAAVLLIHHLRKSGGQEYTGSRGSGALSAFPDVLVELTRFDPANDADRKRELAARGRYDETPARVTLELTDAGYVTVEGARRDAAEAARRAAAETEEGRILAVLAAAGPDGLTSDELRDGLRSRGWGMRDQSISDHLASLNARGAVGVSGRMRSPTDPRRFFIPSGADPVCRRAGVSE